MMHEIAAAIREDWHDAGMYGRADFHPRWLDGLAEVTAQVAALAVEDRLAAVAARAEAAEAKVARIEALCADWDDDTLGRHFCWPAVPKLRAALADGETQEGPQEAFAADLTGVQGEEAQ